MNEAQTIFTIFFAISWSAMSNVLPRWKPFHYAMFWRSDCWQPTRRTLFAFLMFNVLPWVLFAVVMYWLRGTPIKAEEWTLRGSFLLIVRAVLPGLIPFGCYRVWLAVIHWCPDCFYVKEPSNLPEAVKGQSDGAPYEPTQENLGIKDYGSMGDFVFGLLYVLTCLFALIPSAW